MKIYVTYDFNNTFKTLLKAQLERLELEFKLHNAYEIEFKQKLSKKDEKRLSDILKNYHISIIENKKISMVERIKITIEDMLDDDKSRTINSSDYLADKLNYSYTHLSNIFSEATYSSIENYIILRKVDKAKELLINTNATLTEIAFKLNYSSVAHLSRQFKKTTGLTPSAFQRIIEKRKQY